MPDPEPDAAAAAAAKPDPKPEARPRTAAKSRVLEPPPLVDHFVVPVEDGEDIVISVGGTEVPADQLARVEEAAEHSGLELREVES